MELTWFESFILGLFSGLLDILPVSTQAHSILLLKFLGVTASSDVMNMLIHAAIFAALYYSSQTHLIRMKRARALARVPKRKRKRPLDIRSMMDWSMLKTMFVPAVLGVYLRKYTAGLYSNLILISLFLFVNGIILYIPQFFPTSNRDSRTLSRIEGLLMGLGGAARHFCHWRHHFHCLRLRRGSYIWFEYGADDESGNYRRLDHFGHTQYCGNRIWQPVRPDSASISDFCGSRIWWNNAGYQTDASPCCRTGLCRFRCLLLGSGSVYLYFESNCVRRGLYGEEKRIQS